VGRDKKQLLQGKLLQVLQEPPNNPDVPPQTFTVAPRSELELLRQQQQQQQLGTAGSPGLSSIQRNAAAEAASGDKNLEVVAVTQDMQLDVAAGAPAMDDKPRNGLAPAAAPAAATSVNDAMKLQLQHNHSSGASPMPGSISTRDDRAAEQQQRKTKTKWWMCGCLATQE
jgi:hypothetical protein